MSYTLNPPFGVSYSTPRRKTSLTVPSVETRTPVRPIVQRSQTILSPLPQSQFDRIPSMDRRSYYSTKEQKMEWAESTLSEHSSFGSKLKSSYQRIDSALSETIQDEIQKLQDEIAETKSESMGAPIKSMEEELTDTRAYISVQPDISTQIKEQSTAQSQDYQQISARFESIVDASKQFISELKGEQQRMDGNAKISVDRITELNSQLAKLTEDTQGYLEQLNDYEALQAQIISQSSQSISNSTQSSIRELSKSLSKETTTAKSTHGTLCHMLSSVNGEVSPTAEQIRQNSQELSRSFNQSMASISDSTQSALNQIEEEFDLTQFNETIDGIITSTQQDLQQLFNESKDTFIMMESLVDENAKATLSEITSEYQIRQDHSKQITEKFNSFRDVIKNELDLQMSEAVKKRDDLVTTFESQFDMRVTPDRELLNSIYSDICSPGFIESLDERVSTLENQFKDMSMSLFDAVNTVADSLQTCDLQCEELSTTTQETKEELMDLMNLPAEIDNVPSCKEVYNAVRTLSENINTGIADIEHQFKDALSIISEDSFITVSDEKSHVKN